MYTEREQLTIIELAYDEEEVAVEKLRKVLMEQPSNMIYCETQGKLVGIISTGDILRARKRKSGAVKVNKIFTSLYVGEYRKAKSIFQEKQSINALPVVTKDKVLVGEYIRWDELLAVKYELNTGGRNISPVLRDGRHILLVRPNKIATERQNIFKDFKEYLTLHGVNYQCIDHIDVAEYLNNTNLILFVDENELKACLTLLGFVVAEDYEGLNKLQTYRNILKYEVDCNDEKCALYLEKLCEKGISVLGLIFDESEYSRHIDEEIYNKYAIAGETPSSKLPKSMYKDFFDDLYSEEYAEQICNMPLACVNNIGVLSLKDCQSKYYNVINGERQTDGQLAQGRDIKNIYFFGPCYIYGHYVEDKNTIESFLQRLFCDKGISVRVVNYGCLDTNINNRYLTRIAVTQFKMGDVVVVGNLPKGIKGVHYLDLNRVLEKHKVSSKWLADWTGHCNHKVNKLYSDAIYEALVPILEEEGENRGEPIQKDENFIKFMYLDQYFKEFDFTKYNKMGSIVMNCNPFTYGHRYLIEQALKKVDHLIVFVVEEDRSLFSFWERITMVQKGVLDLSSVTVVPSGMFILSQMSFPEYFIKESSDDIVEHTEQDIRTFAEKIAPQLGIKYRFVGEEPDDSVTNQYNLAMKKILPQYGIELVEIPRKKINEKYISASLVRGYMDENNKEKLDALLPKTTREFLGIL